MFMYVCLCMSCEILLHDCLYVVCVVYMLCVCSVFVCVCYVFVCLFVYVFVFVGGV